MIWLEQTAAVRRAARRVAPVPREGRAPADLWHRYARRGCVLRARARRTQACADAAELAGDLAMAELAGDLAESYRRDAGRDRLRAYRLHRAARDTAPAQGV